ncbi:UTP--glucose-1-phosphate uridylyltransferase, partial [Chromohalobacter japonicus]|uniref:UTP--glucose-1-phosphate uridylyltransferase n=1 Tax=Chromohalobacter japonicus TaxID=223900 RepID=UPI003F93324B
EAKGKDELLAEVRNIVPEDVSIIAVRQPVALGLGHAVLCAQAVIGDDPFAVLLPDVLVDAGELAQNDLAGMIEAYGKSGQAQIMVENVPQEMTHKYGIVALEGEAPAPGDSAPLTGMVEKPKVEEAPSSLAVIGRYLLPAAIFPLLADTKPGAGNEIQLTDALETLRQQQGAEAYRMRGNTYDCGHQLGYLEATLALAKRHPQYGEGFRPLLGRYANEG